MKNLTHSFIFLILAFPLFASNDDVDQADHFSSYADSLMTEGWFDSASVYYDKAAKIYENASMWEEYIAARNEQVQALSKFMLPDSAYSIAQISIRACNRHLPPQHALLADAYHELGNVFTRIRYLDSSTFYLQKALTIRSLIFDKEHLKIADSYFSMGVNMLRRKEFDSALYFFNRSHVIRKNSGNKMSGLGQVFRLIAYTYQWKLQFDEAYKYHQMSLEFAKNIHGEGSYQLAMTYAGLGNWFSVQIKYDSALAYYRKSCDILNNDKKLRVNLIENMYSVGFLHIRIHEYDNAFKFLEEYLNNTIRLLGSKHIGLYKGYREMGWQYSKTGQTEKALDNYQLALEVNQSNLNGLNRKIALYNLGGTHELIGGQLQTLGESDRAKEHFLEAVNYADKYGSGRDAGVYSALGSSLVRSGDLSNALHYFKKSLKLRKLEGENHPYVAYPLNAIGSVYSRMGDYNRAMECSLEALALIKAAYPQGDPYISGTLQYLGLINRRFEYHQKALNYYKEALREGIKFYGQYHFATIGYYHDVGDYCIRNGKFKEALGNYQNAIRANISGINKISGNSNPTSDHEFMRPVYLVYSLKSKALILEKLYEEDKEVDQLKLSLHTLQLCDTLIGKIRQSYLLHNDKVALGSTSSEVYQMAVRISLKLYELTENTEFMEDALHFFEGNKAAVLFDSHNDFVAKQYSGIPTKTLTLERELKAEQNYYQSKIIKLESQDQGYDTARLERFKNRRVQINLSLDSLKEVLEAHHPDYYAMRYNKVTLSKKDLQSKLQANEALLSYMESDSFFYVLKVTPETYNIHTVKKDALLDSAMVTFQSSFDWKMVTDNPDKAFSNYSKGANTLYNKLIQPLLIGMDEQINCLIIIPDGKLSYLPWELMLTEEARSKEIDYKSLSYLFKEFNVSYAHSASLHFKDQADRMPANGWVLAFAPSYSAKDSIFSNMRQSFRDALTPLKWNKTEIQSIQNALDGDVYIGDKATEETFKQKAKDYRVLHLAMHALVDSEDPMKSKLVFTQGNDSSEDGMLHTYELFNMDLRADLAVLSACKTGLGKLEKGEGVMSLGRAFAYANCPSVVMSHWSVDDESTSKLMGYFYEALSRGDKKDQALRKAKLQFLAQADVKQHPLYWGGFIVMGDTAPIEMNSFSLKHIIFGLIIILVVMLAFLKLRNMRGRNPVSSVS